MNEARDRFITEALGWCWHDYDPDKPLNTYSLEAFVCNKCKGFILGNNDFSQEEDFLRLLDLIRGKESLQGFLDRFDERDLADPVKGPSSREAFVNALYELLKR